MLSILANFVFRSNKINLYFFQKLFNYAAIIIGILKLQQSCKQAD